MSDDQQQRKARVLLMAYVCSPDHGSEAAIGWNHAVQMAREFDVWVICLDGLFGDAIRAHLRRHGEIPGLKFEFLRKSSWQQAITRIPGLYYLAYNLWHRRAYRKAVELHRKVGFDLVHQLNLCGYREPGYLPKLGAPLVWGPVGGTQNYPWRFLGQAGLRGAISEGLRTLANLVQLRFSPRVRTAVHRAALFLTANSTNQRDFARAHGVQPTLMLETGINHIAKHAKTAGQTSPLRILWSGALAPWKGLPLLFRALAKLPSEVQYEVHILGKGSHEGAYRRLARRCGVDQRITWLGWVSHAEALEKYQWSDVLLFTSLRDTSGNVVIEALAAGVPVVCLDHQGVHDIVTEKCGIKVPVTRPDEVIERLAAAILLLSKDSSLREQLSAGALSRAKDFLWSHRGTQFAALYHGVLAGAHRQGSQSWGQGEVGDSRSSPALSTVPWSGQVTAVRGEE